MHNGKQMRVFPADKLPAGAGTNDFTYSFWFYVNSWSYNYGKNKIIFEQVLEAQKRSKSMPRVEFVASMIKYSFIC